MAKTENENGKEPSPSKGADAGASGGNRDATKDRTIRILEEMNRKLLARVRELELARAGGAEERSGRAAEQEEAEGNKRISSMVKALRGDIDAAYVLKKALETDLADTQRRLSEEEAARRQFESRAGILEAKAALADQLRQDISFVEEEQNKTFRRLGDVTSELQRTTEERDRLRAAKEARDGRIAELQRQRFELEADVIELKERLEEMVSFFGERSRSSSRLRGDEAAAKAAQARDELPGGERKGEAR